MIVQSYVVKPLSGAWLVSYRSGIDLGIDSPDGQPAGSLNMSVANGKTKLLLSIGGCLTAQMTGKPDQRVPANSLNFVGLTTQPIRLLSHQPIRLISVEFAQ